MSERIRITHFEAEDVRELLGEYWRKRSHCESGCGPHDDWTNDLVNAIGEIYENALARKGPARVDAAHGGR